MISASVRITVNNFKGTRKHLSNRFSDFLGFLAETGAQDIKDNYTTSHSPSLPGEPPGIVTGNLKEGTLSTSSVEQATIDIMEEYSVWLEFGTRKMAARPFVRPAVNRLMDATAKLAERFKW